MRRRSLRTTLTVWNAAALTGLLGAFGVAMVFTNQNRLQAAVDDDLRHQAEGAARNGPPPPEGYPSRPIGTGFPGQEFMQPDQGGMGRGGPGRGPRGQGGYGPGGFGLGQPGGGQPGQGPQDDPMGFGPPDGEQPNPPQGGSPQGNGGTQGGRPQKVKGQGGQGPGAPGGPGADIGAGGGASGGVGAGGPGQPFSADPFGEARRLADVRRPRFFDARKQPLNPGDAVPPFDTVGLDLALHRQPHYSDVNFNGQPIRVFSQPIIRNGQVIGAVQFARETSEMALLWQAQMRTLLIMLPLGVLFAAGGAYAFTNRALRPIAQVTQAAAAISRSDLSRRLEVAGDDELAELARTFNDMLGRLDQSFTELEGAYANLTRAYEQQQRFTADASHELRTPLTRLKLATSAALAESTTPEEMRQALATADRAATSMTRLVQQLLMLARADAGQLPLRLEPVDLRVVVAEALEGLSLGRPVESAFADRPVMIRADAENIARVVSNLVENASRHTPQEGNIRVETVRSGNEAVVTVRDTGEGIPAEHLPHLFDRFYRVDTARARKDGGTGLGLAICKNLVEAHGGRLEIESAPGVGTTARIVFPLFSDTLATQTKSS